MSDDEEKVGYRRPPKEHQFKKGQSGNRSGRPRRPRHILTLIERELDTMVTIREAGVEIRLPKRVAIAKRLVNDAMKGSPRAIEYLVKYMEDRGGRDPFEITEHDEVAFRAFIGRQVDGSDSEGIEDARTDET